MKMIPNPAPNCKLNDSPGKADYFELIIKIDGFLAFSSRVIYTLFLQDKSIEEIRRMLAGIGVTIKKGTMLSHNDILYILKNETYKGDKLLQKTHPKDLITKKPDPNVPFESNYLENDHEAIVRRDAWDAAQAKLEENKKIGEVVGHRGGQPLFFVWEGLLRRVRSAHDAAYG